MNTENYFLIRQVLKESIRIAQTIDSITPRDFSVASVFRLENARQRKNDRATISRRTSATFLADIKTNRFHHRASMTSCLEDNEPRNETASNFLLRAFETRDFLT